MALGPDMGATVAETWQAHDAVMHARAEEWGTVGTAMAIRGVEASSSAAYMQQVRMALRGCGTDEPMAVAIQRRFAELALRKRGYSAANNFVAGIRMLEKLKLIRTTVTDLHRLLRSSPCPQEVPPRVTLSAVQFGSGASGCSAARSHRPVRLLCLVTIMYGTSSSAQTSAQPGCDYYMPTLTPPPSDGAGPLPPSLTRLCKF